MPRGMARRSNEYATFLRRLRQAREKAGLSQAETARRLGKPQSFVSKCESGERRVDVIELKAFARVYGTSVASFID
jgi:transcriptional regulator with XRE-family HTH domain